MSPQPAPEPASAAAPLDLQFETAERAGAPAALTCHACQQVITGDYFVANGQPVCSTCSEAAAQHLASPNPGLRELGRAALYGAGAALIGTILYFAVLAITGYELSLIAIGVGWGVGKAVAIGGAHKGGWKLQALAMALTYCSIVGSYVPMIIKESVARQQQKPEQKTGAKQAPAAAAVGKETTPVPGVAGFALVLAFLSVFALAIPFLSALESPIGLVIIAVGLYEAWKINRRMPLALEGPFSPPPAAS